MPTCTPRISPKRYSRPICAPESRPNRSLGQIAEVAGAERPPEPVRDAERALEPRHAQRRRQVDDREVRLAAIRIAIRIVLGGLRGAAQAAFCARGRLRPQ